MDGNRSIYTCPVCRKQTAFMRQLTAEDYNTYKCSCQRKEGNKTTKVSTSTPKSIPSGLFEMYEASGENPKYTGRPMIFLAHKYHSAGITGDYYEVTAYSIAQAEQYCNKIGLDYVKRYSFSNQECEMTDPNTNFTGGCVGRYDASNEILKSHQ
jgi:hypothetical protein